MHTEESLRKLEDELLKKSVNSNLLKKEQKAAYSQLGRLRKSRYIVEMGFSESYLQAEVTRLSKILVGVEKWVDKYATDKKGNIVNSKKLEIEKNYNASLIRTQIKNIRLILEV